MAMSLSRYEQQSASAFTTLAVGAALMLLAAVGTSRAQNSVAAPAAEKNATMVERTEHVERVFVDAAHWRDAEGLGRAWYLLARLERREQIDKLADLISAVSLADTADGAAVRSIVADLDIALVGALDEKLLGAVRAMSSLDDAVYEPRNLKLLAKQYGVSEASLRTVLRLPEGLRVEQIEHAVGHLAAEDAAFNLLEGMTPSEIVMAVYDGDPEVAQELAARAYSRAVAVFFRRHSLKGVPAEHWIAADPQGLAQAIARIPSKQLPAWTRAGVPLNPIELQGVDPDNPPDTVSFAEFAAVVLDRRMIDAGLLPTAAERSIHAEIASGKWVGNVFNENRTSTIIMIRAKTRAAVTESPAMEGPKAMLLATGGRFGWARLAKALTVDSAKLQMFAQSPRWENSGGEWEEPKVIALTHADLARRIAIMEAQLIHAIKEYQVSSSPAPRR